MERVKKSCFAVFLAILLLFTGILMVSASKQKAYALSPECNLQNQTIYYFTDYFPTLSRSDMEEKFPDYNIYIDHQDVNEQSFASLVENDYFEVNTILDDFVLIIDIKTFKPAPSVLKALFQPAKEQGCITAFVTGFEDNDYDGKIFLQYVDVFVVDWKCARLQNLYSAAFLDFEKNGGVAGDTNYFIDIRTINVDDIVGADWDMLCNASPLLRVFVEQLAICLENNQSIEYDSYNDLADILSEYNVRILVQISTNEFVDLLTKSTYTLDISELTSGDSPQYLCGFGIWAFTRNFYNAMNSIQKAGYNLPIYPLLVDPEIEDPEGLQIITKIGPGEYSNEAGEELANGVHDALTNNKEG